MHLNVAVVGAGPAGLYMAIALAKRGHNVTVIDSKIGTETYGMDDKDYCIFVSFIYKSPLRQMLYETIDRIINQYTIH